MKSIADTESVNQVRSSGRKNEIRPVRDERAPRFQRGLPSEIRAEARIVGSFFRTLVIEVPNRTDRHRKPVPEALLEHDSSSKKRAHR
ncbi:MAG: hypothetical protein RJB38_658 [Pseudomonadota bacterium]